MVNTHPFSVRPKMTVCAQRDGQFDNLVIGEEMTAEKLTASLEGRKIVALKRRGKQMWFLLDK